MGALQHRPDTIRDFEGGFGLTSDLLDRDAVGELDERQSFGEVDVEYALKDSVINLNALTGP